jgi:hypothetical protein
MDARFHGTSATTPADIERWLLEATARPRLDEVSRARLRRSSPPCGRAVEIDPARLSARITRAFLQ